MTKKMCKILEKLYGDDLRFIGKTDEVVKDMRDYSQTDGASRCIS